MFTSWEKKFVAWEHRRHLESLVKELDGPDADAKNKALNELIERAQGGDAEAEALIFDNFKRAVKFPLKDPALSVEDLEQEAWMALWNAGIRGYDPTRKFEVWAKWRIKNEYKKLRKKWGREVGVRREVRVSAGLSRHEPAVKPWEPQTAYSTSLKGSELKLSKRLDSGFSMMWGTPESGGIEEDGGVLLRSKKRKDLWQHEGCGLWVLEDYRVHNPPVSAESEFLSKHHDDYWKKEVRECVCSLPDYRRFVCRWGIWWGGPMKPEEQAEWEGISKQAVGNSQFAASKRLSRHFKNENGRLIRRSA